MFAGMNSGECDAETITVLSERKQSRHTHSELDSGRFTTKKPGTIESNGRNTHSTMMTQGHKWQGEVLVTHTYTACFKLTCFAGNSIRRVFSGLLGICCLNRGDTRSSQQELIRPFHGEEPKVCLRVTGPTHLAGLPPHPVIVALMTQTQQPQHNSCSTCSMRHGFVFRSATAHFKKNTGLSNCTDKLNHRTAPPSGSDSMRRRDTNIEMMCV